MSDPSNQNFDVSRYEIEDFTSVTILNAKGDDDLLGTDGKPVVFEVYSSGSKQGQKALFRAGRESTARLQRALRGKSSKTEAEDADREQVEKLVAFTKSISPNFPLSAEAVYSNPKLGYIRRQIERLIDDDANFAKSSTTS